MVWVILFYIYWLLSEICVSKKILEICYDCFFLIKFCGVFEKVIFEYDLCGIVFLVSVVLWWYI